MLTIYISLSICIQTSIIIVPFIHSLVSCIQEEAGDSEDTGPDSIHSFSSRAFRVMHPGRSCKFRRYGPVTPAARLKCLVYQDLQLFDIHMFIRYALQSLFLHQTINFPHTHKQNSSKPKPKYI